MRTLSMILALLAIVSSSANGAKKVKPAPPDLVKRPFVPVAIEAIHEGTDRVDIFLLMGQSNMKGRGVMPKQPLRDPQIIMMHKGNDGWYHARHPLHMIGNPKDFRGADNAGVGPGLAFAQAVAKAQPNTRIALIPCAVGGTSIASWRKGKTLYDETIRRAKLALSQGPKDKTRIAGALWLQGEADGKTVTRVQAYQAALGRMIDDLRKDTGVRDLPFIACTIGEMRERWEGTAKINAILLDIPTIRSYTACVDSRGFAKHIGDGVHFDTATQEEHGRRYAVEYLKIERGK